MHQIQDKNISWHYFDFENQACEVPSVVCVLAKCILTKWSNEKKNHLKTVLSAWESGNLEMAGNAIHHHFIHNYGHSQSD